MAKVALRGYLSEVDRLIDNNQLDEAIAHCIHILASYPKHVDTYRLLGKAFLERQRYRDAADMFMRVLAIFPDDFVAHIGISIVREEQAELDLAIFHMERAFEVQPSNTAIQDELKRLYGKRDGVIPLKIRLTHPALARLYSKGDLNQQAVSELRVALAETPARTDILAQLAELYTKSNQTSDAIDTCNKLIEQLPYCFGALNVLTRLLPGTPDAKDVSIYQSRLNELDPYNAKKVSPTQTPGEISDDSVMIEPLIWSTDAQVTVNQNDWAGSLGINLVEPEKYDASLIPTKSTTFPPVRGDESPTRHSVRQTAPLTEPVNTPPDSLPEWMKTAGWSKSEDIPDAFSGLVENSQINHEAKISSDSVLINPEEISSLDSRNTSENSENKSSPTKNVSEIESSYSPISPGDQGLNDSTEAAASISPELIPDWLRSIAPPEITQNQSQSDQNAVNKMGNTPDDTFSSIFLGNSSREENPASPVFSPQEFGSDLNALLQNRNKSDNLQNEEKNESTQKDEIISPVFSEPKSNLETTFGEGKATEVTAENEKLENPISNGFPVTKSSDSDPLASLRLSFQSENASDTISEQDSHELPVEPEDQPLKPFVAGEKEVPDWLRNLSDTTEIPGKPQSVNTPKDELPEWLQDFEQKIDQPPASSPPFPPSLSEDSTLEIPQPDQTNQNKTSDHVGKELHESKFLTKELPVLSSEKPINTPPEDIGKTGNILKTSVPKDEPATSPETPPIIDLSKDERPLPAEEDSKENEERPAWLSKLVGIDDVERPNFSLRGKPSLERVNFSEEQENPDDIPGASQAAWIIDKVSSKDSDQQETENPSVPPLTQQESKPKSDSIAPEHLEPTTEKDERKPITDLNQIVEGLQAIPVMDSESSQKSDQKEKEIPLAPQPLNEDISPISVPEVSPETKSFTEHGETEPVPDLSLIVEGLQAAWMSERVDETAIFQGNVPEDKKSPSPQSPSDETVIIKPTEDQFIKESEQKPDIFQPIIEKNVLPKVTKHNPSINDREKQIPVSATVPAEDILIDARAASSHGLLDESLDRYVELINRNRLIDNVIEDLEAMASSQQDVSDIWQTLGDAYTRRNKLDLALSAYRKAEDLLK